jgi:hypothetical protein
MTLLQAARQETRFKPFPKQAVHIYTVSRGKETIGNQLILHLTATFCIQWDPPTAANRERHLQT